MGIFSKLFTPKYNPKASNYKMNTLEEINNIPVPTQNFQYNCDFTESVEYVLQRKATQFKKAGQMDLAIACLKKSNEIMPFAPMTYTSKDYERLEKYLKLARRFDEAGSMHEHVQSTLSGQKHSIIEKRLELSNLSDYIEVPRLDRPCLECAKYHDRIYSKNCKNGFPDIKIFLEYINSKVCSCYLSFFPFFYETSVPTLSQHNNVVAYSNRPFVDDRTPQEREKHEKYMKEVESDAKDRRDYDWICEHLPDVAPKSYGGYRNMKNKNSTNYQKIVLLAKEKNYYI